MTPAQPIFSEEDRAYLRKLHCNKPQIDALEQLLPAIRALNTQMATLTDVRENLIKLQKNFQQSIDIYESNIQSGVEARTRLQEAGLVNCNNPSAFETSLRLLNDLVVQSLKTLPSGQRRNRKANPLFVQWIYEAILNNNNSDCDPDNNFTFPIRNQPLLWTRGSNKKRSNFEKIVFFCLYKSQEYSDITEPKRAIGAFYKLLNDKYNSEVQSS
jgi:hypothetical protein